MRSMSPTHASTPSSRTGMPNSGRKVALQGLARLSTDVFLENPVAQKSITKKPFTGLVICATGLSREARKEVQTTIERMGGQYSRDLHVNCTHLVVQTPAVAESMSMLLNMVCTGGLHIVSMLWWEDCVKQNARLDESLYMVQKIHQVDIVPEGFSEANGNRRRSSASRDLEASIQLQPNSLSMTKSSGCSLRNSSSMPRTPHSTLTTDKSNHALAGARFYLDSDLPRDVQSKAQEAVESWGATCVENWSKATHVVCESETISKYIGLNLHLVSPMWVLSARDGFPLRCVQYSADLARDISDLLLTWKDKSQITRNLIKTSEIPHNGRAAEASLQERERKVTTAKAGVRRRRGSRMQPIRTLPRLITPTSLLDSICWAVTDEPTAAQLYTNRSGKVEVTKGSESGLDDFHFGGRYNDALEALGKEIFTRPLSGSEKREIVFRGAFLTILFPIDRFSELGPSSRTFFSEGGHTRRQIIDFIYTFYQEPLTPAEVEAAIHTDSKHADRLRALYASKETNELGYISMKRFEFLGSRQQFEGLKRANQEPTSHIYDLWLGS